MKAMNWMLGSLVALSGGLLLASADTSEETAPTPRVLVATIDGAIGPATTEYVRSAIDRASELGVQAMVLRIDTPGGLEAATRDIDKAILASAVPVVTYVSPSGARAASAGTYILYASHVAAMAPGTNLGAATPVPIGGPQPQRPAPAAKDDDKDDEDEAKDKDQPGQPGTAMERKILHDSSAYIRALAELRGRNAEWGEKAVREGASLTASEALAKNVIEYIAGSLDGLLEQIDGLEVKLDSDTVTLRTAGAEIIEFHPDWRNRLLSVITNPSVAYLLLLVGLYGLLLEGYNPGAMVPGVVGVVSLLLAAYALQVLPVNYAGLALIVVGVGLMLAEVITPSFGVLGIGGLFALVLGSVILFDTDMPGFGVSRGLIAGIAASSGGAFLLMMMMLGKSRRAAVTTGDHELLALPAVATEDFSGDGHVRIRSELWKAHCDTPVTAGQILKVEAVEGLTLHVRPRS
ncbi:MAG TPA: nodulation protein NfeD [Xanthomonadaceae bacterium]|nr:nodulation protein NfeD [Xanthomonadaceae bacterium]